MNPDDPSVRVGLRPYAAGGLPVIGPVEGEQLVGRTVSMFMVLSHWLCNDMDEHVGVCYMYQHLFDYRKP